MADERELEDHWILVPDRPLRPGVAARAWSGRTTDLRRIMRELEMHRTSFAVVMSLAAFAATGPSFAIEASDTMAAWKNASTAEKSELATKLLKEGGRDGNAASVVKCLDLAAAAPGHSELRISRIFEACEKAQGEPV